MLQRVSEQGNGGRLPEWLSTHPEPEHRIEHVHEQIADASAREQEPRVDRDPYLKQLEGLVYGTDPRQGFVQGGRFYHPELGFMIDVPQKWKTQNTREALIMASPEQDVLVQISAGPVEEPQRALSTFAQQDGVRLGRSLGGVVPDLRSASAELAITTQDQGDLGGIVTFAVLAGHTFQLLAVAPANAASDRMDDFRKQLSTFRPADARSVKAVEPARVHLIEAPADMTLAALYGRQPASIPLARVALLNQLEPESKLRAGELVKWVVGGSQSEGGGNALGE
jgi:predicted Zn-dependent protease